MSGRPELQRLRRAVTGIPANLALRHLADQLADGGGPARCAAVAELLEEIAGAMDAQQAAVRDGLPVDSEPDKDVTVHEYAVRSTGPDGTRRLTTYWDRLYAATHAAMSAPDAELLRRTVVVGPWGPGPEVPASGIPWWPGIT